LKRSQDPGRRQVPEQYTPGSVGADQAFFIQPGQATNRILVSRQGRDRRAVLDRPDADLAVKAAAGESFSAGVESQPVGAGRVDPAEIDIRRLGFVRCAGNQQTDEC